MSAVRTLGVEEELHVVDLATGRLAPRAPQLLHGLPAEGFSTELQRSTVETNTEVCTDLSQLRAELVRLRMLADGVAARYGLGVAASGTAPHSAAEDFELTALGRFSRMQQDYRLLVDDQLICGLQVHVGVADRDVAVRVAQRVAGDIPTLLAMSASSPFWHGRDTGYSSFRTMVWQRWPTAGSFGRIGHAAEYDRLLRDLIGSGVIADAKMAYFDVRPSAHVPTVELRVCDACPLVDDAVLIAGLFRALVDEAVESDGRGDALPERNESIHRAAMWRAARSGLSGSLLDAGSTPRPMAAAEVVQTLVGRLRPYLDGNGDTADVDELSAALLARGESAGRQRARYAEHGLVTDVVGLVLAETRGTASPVVGPPELADGYPDAPEDEALGSSGIPYPAYRPLFGVLDRLGQRELVERGGAAQEHALKDGFTFGVGGRQQAFPADLVPRIVPAHEWSELADGLTQRARAIEAFLRDIYGDRQVLLDHVIDEQTVLDCPGFLPDAARLPPDTMRAPVIGFDLVRDAFGGWRVLEDNARVPSGVGYAIGMRRLMQQVMPELAGGLSLRDPYTVLGLIGDTLRAIGPAGARAPLGGRSDDAGAPVVALLSDGADNSAWYEHRLIAAEARLVLVQPDELEVRGGGTSAGGGVWAGGRRIDVLYLRLGVELADLRSADGDELGRAIFEAAVAGEVVLANAPGAGVADDKSMYCLVPDLIAYYLGERPLLSPVPTYRCASPAELGSVLERLDELVTKPVDGYGGGGVLIGPHAAPGEIDRRRRDIEAFPAGWIAQEVVSLSTHPTLVDGRVQPRHVDLRAFVYSRGTGPDDVRLADIALTRVAPAGSMVVNSSRGGGAKDTWIIADPVDPSDPSDPSAAIFDPDGV